jgi:hypothetical protein
MCRPMVALAVISLLFSIPLQAAEVLVKNDSIQNNGQAVIVGNFIAGEHAGVRLTSPCNGAIVAVQILWLEGTPGHPPSLEDAIHIYAGATFPTPGAELALLEGPVLTPGYWNEFRYLDEAGTIPLNVPVTAGQQFYVTLQFYNPTDVGNGGPSVVRDVDGCQNGKNVIYAIPGGWWNSCLLGVAGDFAIRAIVNCPDPTGACCYADGTCANGVTQADCTAQYGATWYNGQTCGQVTCTPRGACCRAGGCLPLVSPANCAAIGGTYAGHGTNCADSVCVAGACCQIDGSCVQNFGFQCTALGGTFQGPGTSCTPNPCPQPVGACCFGTFCIPGQTNADCTGAGGTWAGAFTTCEPVNPCLPPAGCAGDTNCDGEITFADIDSFVEALSGPGNWQHDPCPWSNADTNGDGDVTFADIDSFVALIGTSCP